MPSPKYSPRMISLLIREAGWTQARIAKALEMSQGAISYGIQTGASPRIREWVSNLLQLDETELWPQRFIAAKKRTTSARRRGSGGDQMNE